MDIKPIGQAMNRRNILVLSATTAFALALPLGWQQ
jgi:hypothetical protein